MKLWLRRSKTAQVEKVYIAVFATNSIYCPVNALRHYVKTLNYPSTAPLFWSAGKPLTAERFNFLLKTLIDVAGLKDKGYSSHSLRSGAATVAADAGVPAWVIQRLGRWKSDCYKIYIKNNKRSIRMAQSALDI